MASLLMTTFLLTVGARMQAQETGRQSNDRDYVKDEVIVRFKNDVMTVADGSRLVAPTHSAMNDVLQGIGAGEARQLMPLTSQSEARSRVQGEPLVPAWQTPRKPIDLSYLYVMKIDTAMTSVAEAVERLQDLEDVAYAQPNHIHRNENAVDAGTPATTPQRRASADGIDYAATDPYLADQWYLAAIRMPELWEQPIIHERRPVVAVVDTGVDTLHVDLRDNLLLGWNAENETNIVYDYEGHGTSCASVVAAVGGNGGMVGANPLALLLPIAKGYDDVSIIRAVDYAVAQGADILSCSFVFYDFRENKAMQDVFALAMENAIVVAGAGNSFADIAENPHFPACYPGIIGVMATNEDGALAIFSNHDRDGSYYSNNGSGYNYELRAPGANMLVAQVGGDYFFSEGTSFATPLVAGAISRLLMCRDCSSREQLLRALVESCGSHFDAMAAYHYQQPLSGTFTRNICGHDITFVKTDENCLTMGDGVHPCLEGTLKAFTIPDAVAGYAVTAIAPNAFKDVTIGRLTLPYMLREIGSGAFHDSHIDTLDVHGLKRQPVCADDAFCEWHFQNTFIAANGVYLADWLTDGLWSRFAKWDVDYFYANISGAPTKFCFTDATPQTLILGINGETAIPFSFEGTFVIPDEVAGFQVTNVAGYALSECPQMKGVVLPSWLTDIPEGLCRYDASLQHVAIPEGVRSIGMYAFSECALTEIELPASLISLGHEAFASNPPYVMQVANATPIDLKDEYGDDSHPFGDADFMKACTLRVPQGSKAAYEAAPGWCEFGTIEEYVTSGVTPHHAGVEGSDGQWYFDMQGRRVNVQSLRKGVYVSPHKKKHIKQ